MKILIVSDTHGKNMALEDAVEREAPFDMLIHCGDVEGREFFIEALADGPSCIISGNNDFFSDLPREEVITISGKQVFVTHGHTYGVNISEKGIVEAARARGCQVVLFGHTHRPVVSEKDGVLLVNPGSLAYPRQEGRKPSYAVMKTDYRGNMEVKIKYLGR